MSRSARQTFRSSPLIDFAARARPPTYAGAPATHRQVSNQFLRNYRNQIRACRFTARTAAPACSAAGEHYPGSSTSRGVIRRARAEDVASIAEIDQSCSSLGSAGWTPALVQGELTNPISTVLIHEKEGPPEAASTSSSSSGGGGGSGSGGRAASTKITGFVVVWQVAGVEAQIIELAVDPAHHRQGIGRQLLRACLRACRADSLPAVLEVKAGNAAAVALYASHGFVQVGRRKRFYEDGSDALLMERQPAVVPNQ